MSDRELQSLIDELIARLDEQMELLVEKDEQMVRLSEAMIARDDSVTELVLERMEHTRLRSEAAEGRLEKVRSNLASKFRVPQNEMRLSRLVEILDPPLDEEIARRRQCIIELADNLQRRHLRTVMLLNECSRVNRMMLERLMPSSGPVVTYGADGTGRSSCDAGMLDMES